MTNYEKYKEEIKKFEHGMDLFDFIRDNVPCTKEFGNCFVKIALFAKWLDEEYEKPEVDWSKVEVDTPIIVKTCEGDKENRKRYFAKYENGLVYAWSDGRNSWSSINDDDVISWKYAKLAEDVTDD